MCNIFSSFSIIIRLIGEQVDVTQHDKEEDSHDKILSSLFIDHKDKISGIEAGHAHYTSAGFHLNIANYCALLFFGGHF